MTSARTFPLAALALILGLAGCGPAAPPEPHELVRRFDVGVDEPIASDAVRVAGDAWLLIPGEPRSVTLFEIENPGVESVLLTYRARMASSSLKGKAYLELWVRLPGRGMFFSRGLEHALQGTTGWASYEIPFRLRTGERPDLIRLGVLFEDPSGHVSIKDMALYKAPLDG